jgi:His-Xaa-Ser system radical SAM maturase HxsB
MNKALIPLERFYKNEYYLLPFRFEPFESGKEILTNDYGDFIICPKGISSKIANHKLCFEKDYDLLTELYSKNFISDKIIPDNLDNLSTRYRTKKAFLDNFTSLHIIVLTIRCNQKCEYCQVTSRQNNQGNFDISFDNLENTLNLIFQSPSQYLTIEFQGGEPTLVPEKIKFAVEKAKELNITKNKFIKFVLCTNLINISNETLAFCRLHDILISTSLDGPKSIHDKNRVYCNGSSYDNVIKGIKKARIFMGIENVSALMTTTRYSLNNPEEIIKCYIENGFTNIFLRDLNPYGYTKTSGKGFLYSDEEFIDFYKRTLRYILDLNYKGVFFVEDFATLILKKILTPFSISFVDLQSPSGIINGVVVYNYDGFVYASDEARMMAEEGDYTFQLGNVKDNYNDIFLSKKVFDIAKHWANECYVGCSDCGFQPYCGTDPVRNYSIQGDLEGYRASSSFCKKHYEIIKYLFQLLADDYNSVFQVFQSWITNKPLHQ